MAKATPLNQVKQQFGGKADLVDKVVALIEPKGEESSDAHKRRLKNVSNSKLLHLLALGEKVKSLGGRDAIVKRILELKGQGKDHEYGDKLKRLPLGRIVDVLGGLDRTARAIASPKPAAKPKAKAAAPAKAAVKAPAKATSKAGKPAAKKAAAAKAAKAGTRSRATR